MDEQLVHSALLDKAIGAKYSSVEVAEIKKEQEIALIEYFLRREALKVLNQRNFTDEELKETFDLNKERYLIEKRVKLDSIFIKDKEKATEILKKVKDDNFDELKSENDEKENKEESKDFIKISDLFPDIANAIEEVKNTGIIKKLIEVSGAFHIINVKEIEEERKATFEEAKDLMISELREKLFMDIKINIINSILQEEKQFVKGNEISE